MDVYSSVYYHHAKSDTVTLVYVHVVRVQDNRSVEICATSSRSICRSGGHAAGRPNTDHYGDLPFFMKRSEQNNVLKPITF